MKTLLLPAYLLGFNGAAVWLICNGASRWSLLALFVVAVAGMFAAERVIPYNAAEWNRSHGDAGRDFVHAVVNGSLNHASLLLLPLIGPAIAWSGAGWPMHWPLAIQLVIAVLIADLGITIAHAASHRINWLWKFHSVHHSATRMYGFNGLMKHPVHQSIEGMAGVLPLLLFGIPGEVAWLLVFAIGVQLLLQHSNADYRTGPFGWFLAVNVVHRAHHRKGKGMGDVNFGMFTTLWDIAMGTFAPPGDRLYTRDIGLSGKESHMPVDYLGQIAWPFRQGGRHE